jgi:hypothetical protein
MVYCSGACRAAAFRAGRAGDVPPFAPSPRSSADSLVEIVQMSLAAEAALPDAAMQRVEAAEKQLQAARREASKAFEAAGRSTSGMFAESAFVTRRTAEKWRAEARAEAVKTPVPGDPGKAYREREARRYAYYHPDQPPAEPEDAAGREQAVRARWEAATPEERGKMIVEAAARSRPSKRK